MKNSTNTFVRSPFSIGVGVLLVGAVMLALFSANCYPAVSESERCNPYLSHNECAGDPDIQCVVPDAAQANATCSVAFCCGPKSTSDNCLGKASDCIAPDSGAAGDDGGGDAPPADAGSDTGSDAASDAADAGPG